jgi:Zn finger protein HypA/HybF involved in hydrogenase expression
MKCSECGKEVPGEDRDWALCHACKEEAFKFEPSENPSLNDMRPDPFDTY